jgi:hypothetical protein
LYKFLSENRVSFYLFLFIICILCKIQTESFVYFDNDDLTSSSQPQYTPYNPNYVPTNQGFRVEIDGKSIYEMDSNPEHNRHYIPYDPNYVYTSQGYRTELPNTEISPTVNKYERIPNVSHFPPVSQSSCPLGEVRSNQSSGPLGIIETNETNPMEPEIYYPHPSTRVEYKETATVLTRLKDKLKEGYKTVDNFYKKDIEKYQQKQELMEEYYRKTMYVKGKG